MVSEPVLTSRARRTADVGVGVGGTAGTAGLFPHHAMWGNTIKPQPLKNGRGRDSDGGAAAGASQETKGAAESKERHEEGEFPQH